ncbi:MAG TPA: hypothetical protein DCG57_17990 [Candidatus Riflebacteria bacterium]|jgi:hypothetical protein|nr:hypothetical protein [Candidatus Riflebacteria bacterium]
MTTSYEFLPAEDRKIRTPRISLALFLVSAVAFIVSAVVMSSYSKTLEFSYQAASARVENEAMSFISRARDLMPNPAKISDIAAQTSRHNLEMGESTSVWTRLFNTLDAVMPEDSAIQIIENPKTGKMIFAAADRRFKIRIVLAGPEAANDVYARLAALQAIESLSFTPRGEMRAATRQGLAVDLEFTFNETYATTP